MSILKRGIASGIYVHDYLSSLLIILLLGLICIFSASANAIEAEKLPVAAETMETPVIEAEKMPEITPERKSRIFTAIEGPRDFLSDKVITYTKNIDQFFGDERYFQEDNNSVIKLFLNETIAQGGNRNFVFEGKAKLDLPATQRSFKIVLESNPEQKVAAESNTGQPAAVRESAKPEQYSAALRYEQSEGSRWHFSSDVGVKLKFPLDLFTRVRGSYSIPLGDWRMKITETLFWFDSIGLGSTTQLDMEHLLSPSVLFRATSTATCLKAPQNCNLRQDLTIFHTLNDRAAMLYQASILGVSEPEPQKTAYVLQTRYRYRWHKDWVFYEIIPQLNFPRTDDFRLNASLLLRLEILFGATN